VLLDSGEAAVSEVHEEDRLRARGQLEQAGCDLTALRPRDVVLLETVLGQRGRSSGGSLMTAVEAAAVVHNRGRVEDVLSEVRQSRLGDIPLEETSLRGRPDTVVCWAPTKRQWLPRGGCVADCWQDWKAAGAPCDTVEMVRGLRPDWEVLPAPMWFTNHPSVEEHSVWVREELEALLACDKVAVWPLEERGLPHVVMQCKVVCQGDKKRLVLNGSVLSACEKRATYPMDDIDSLGDKLGSYVLEPGEWIDLRVDDFKGAYHQLRLDDSFHKYVCVQLCGLLVAYQVPVFGMLSSCKAMCHAGQWAVQHCAAPVQGLQAGIYIDDATTLDKVTQEGQARHDQVTQGVQRLGFVHCLEKRQQGSRVNDLGYVLDGVDQTISVQEGKVQELRQLVQQATSAGELRARALASMHGKFVHCARVVTGVLAVTRGVVARHFRCIRQRRLWDKMLYLSARDQQDLKLALQLVEQARPWPVPVGRVPWLDVRLDSSDYAMGLCILKGDQVLVALHMRWDEVDVLEHITMKELRCFSLVAHAIDHCVAQLQGVHMRLHIGSDNQAACASALRGSKLDRRQSLVTLFWEAAVARGMQLVGVTWVPTADNWLADLLSRLEGLADKGQLLCTGCDGGLMTVLLGEVVAEGCTPGTHVVKEGEMAARGAEWLQPWRHVPRTAHGGWRTGGGEVAADGC